MMSDYLKTVKEGLSFKVKERLLKIEVAQPKVWFKERVVWSGKLVESKEGESINVTKGVVCVGANWKKRVYEVGKMIAEAVGERLKEVRKVNGGTELTIKE